jgi:hypothetical protein
VPIIRMLPVIVVLSVVLALTVCALAWILAGRPTRGRARHGIETRRHPLELDQPAAEVDEPAGAAPRYKGPDDDPDFIRQLERTIAEHGRGHWQDGDQPPEPPFPGY